ncbi:hypothetical protein QBC34DRAFT_426265 [Podospora aff. communis PSN243]|uniref:Secreted protein n=1 Tax=Podospora aff. communis PSN243 TaxID=3040156 RepID=A0AAV9GMD8_9PEZI|nr:hypothetical protein QBC34DRAFT_426265 [Podospora aff. communis PSN243]
MSRFGGKWVSFPLPLCAGLGLAVSVGAGSLGNTWSPAGGRTMSVWSLSWASGLGPRCGCEGSRRCLARGCERARSVKQAYARCREVRLGRSLCGFVGPGVGVVAVGVVGGHHQCMDALGSGLAALRLSSVAMVLVES